MNKLAVGAEDSKVISKGKKIERKYSIIDTIILQSVNDGSARQRRQMKNNQSGLNFFNRA